MMLTSLSFIALTLLNLVSATNSSQTCTTIEVRKEWRDLTSNERKAWIDAVNCLSTRPRSGKLNPPLNTAVDYTEIYDQIAPVTENSTYYDDFVYAHMDLNRKKPFTHIPNFGQPTQLQPSSISQDCSSPGTAYTYTNGPTLSVPNAVTQASRHTGLGKKANTADFENSAIWDTDSESGLGGFGDPDDDYTLKTGGLNLTLAYPIAHKLRRQYRPFPGFAGFSNVSANSTFSQAEVNVLLSQPEGNFTAFQYYMEQVVGMHSAIHGILGGDLAGLCPKGSSNTSLCPTEGAPTFSANEPMFHMHHGNVDRLWWLWQEKSEINKAAFHGGSVQNMSALPAYPNGQAPWLNKTSLIPTAGIFESYSIEQVMDTRTWPLCYVYE